MRDQEHPQPAAPRYTRADPPSTEPVPTISDVTDPSNPHPAWRSTTLPLPENRGTASGRVVTSSDGALLAVLTATGISIVTVADARPVVRCTNIATATSMTPGVTPLCGAPLASVLVDGTGHAFASDPSRNEIDVINIHTGALETTIDVGAEPHGLDLSPDGATLYVADMGGSQVSVVDVATRRETGRINIPPTPSNDRPLFIAVADNGKALVSTTETGSGIGSRLLEITLSTGAVRLRPDFWSAGGRTTQFTPLAASADHSHIGIAIGDISNGAAFLYRAASDTFTPEHVFGFLNSIAVDDHGTRVVVGPKGYVLDGSMNVLGIIPTTGLATAVAASGKTAYRLKPLDRFHPNPDPDVVDVVDLTQATVAREILIPEHISGFPGGIALSPDGTTLAVLTVSGLSLVSTIASVKGYTALVPVRICDTRTASSAVPANQCNHAGPAPGPLGPAAAITVAVGPPNGIPATATAFVLNVTATNTTAVSFLTVWPTGLAQPTAANLVWQAGQTVTNLVEVTAGTAGAVSVYNNVGSADVVIDLQGYVDSSSTNLFNPLPPSRICDTRIAGPGVPANQCQSAAGAAGTLGPASSTKTVTVAGLGGVPGGATAAVMNVTVTNPAAVGYYTVWPHGTPRPLAANLIWVPGQTVSNRVMVGLGDGGAVDIFLGSPGAADVVVDVNGSFSPTPGGSGYDAGPPQRICDTRVAGPGVEANRCNNPYYGDSKLGPNSEMVLWVPASDTAQVLNVTVTNTTANSYMSVFADTNPGYFITPPLAADLVWQPGQTVTNLVVVAPAGAFAALAFYNLAGTADVIVDRQGGYLPNPTLGAAPITTPSAHAVVRHRGTP